MMSTWTHEDWQLLFAAVGALGAVTAGISLVVGFRQFNRQMNAQTFLAYTQRYEQIMCELPEGVRLGRFGAPSEMWVSDPKVQQAYLRYFSMCSEEYYLYRRKYVDPELWAIWKQGIVRTVRSPLGIAIWPVVEHEFDLYQEFQEWIRKVQREAPEAAAV
jgi:hypothetical protein